MAGNVDRVDYFGGATWATRENAGKRDGLALGNFINININDRITGSFQDRVLADPLFMHEYGHTFQSRRWGPLYLPIPGFFSLISANNSKQITKWDNPLGLYTHDVFWTETRANRYAERYFRRRHGVNNWTSLFHLYPIRNPFR